MIDKHICIVKGWKFEDRDDTSDKNLVEVNNTLLDLGMYNNDSLQEHFVMDKMFSNYIYFGAVAVDEDVQWDDWQDSIIIDEAVSKAWDEFEEWKRDNPDDWARLEPYCSAEPKMHLFLNVW